MRNLNWIGTRSSLMILQKYVCVSLHFCWGYHTLNQIAIKFHHLHICSSKFYAKLKAIKLVSLCTPPLAGEWGFMWVWWAFNVLTPPYPGSGCLVKYWQLASLTTIIMCSPTTDHGEIFFKEIFIFLVSYFLNLETKVGKKWQILVINMAEFSLFSSFYLMNMELFFKPF